MMLEDGFIYEVYKAISSIVSFNIIDLKTKITRYSVLLNADEEVVLISGTLTHLHLMASKLSPFEIGKVFSLEFPSVYITGTRYGRVLSFILSESKIPEELYQKLSSIAIWFHNKYSDTFDSPALLSGEERLHADNRIFDNLYFWLTGQIEYNPEQTKDESLLSKNSLKILGKIKKKPGIYAREIFENPDSGKIKGKALESLISLYEQKYVRRIP